MGHEEGRLTDMRKAPRSVCKICWCSVFPDDKTVWVTTPTPGIAHAVCVEEQENPPKQ